MTGTSVILAHGIGERADLPIPFSAALIGAIGALLASFVVLGLAWRRARFESDAPGLPLARLTRLVDSRWFTIGLPALGLVITGYIAAAAWFGRDLRVNPTFGAVYVLLWLGIPVVSVLIGPVWRRLNPLRTVHLLLTRALRIPTETGLMPFPARLGYWPAAVGLFAFVWLELVAPGQTTLATIRLWFAVYAVVHLFAALLYGSRWFDRGDAFEVYSRLFGHLSPLRRCRTGSARGRLVLANPLRTLAQLNTGPGVVAVVAVLLGATAFDGFSAAPVWVRFVQTSSVGGTVLGTGALLGFILLVAGTLWPGARAAGRIGHVEPAERRRLPGRFAPSVVPIALGYLVAHYVTLFVVEGQRTVVQLTDPLANGADLLGLAGNEPALGFTDDPGTVATVKVLAVVTGHVLGILAAHDRAVALLPRRSALAGQLPLLVVMIGYTLGGLTLLFAT